MSYMEVLLKKERAKGKAEGIRFTAKSYSAVVLLCLKDKFDFSTEQLQEAAMHIGNTFDSVCEGYLSLEDIEQVLDEENDLEIRFGTNPSIKNKYESQSRYKGGLLDE